MTKKIIIDGVDVSGCPHLDDSEIWGEYPECYIDSYECDTSPNCLYKQLARLQAQYNAVVEQNKQLQQELATCKCNYGNEMDYQKIYKQAIEEIKEVATDLRTRTNYRSPDEVNADIDKILQKCEVIDCE